MSLQAGLSGCEMKVEHAFSNVTPGCFLADNLTLYDTCLAGQLTITCMSAILLHKTHSFFHCTDLQKLSIAHFIQVDCITGVHRAGW